MTKTNRMPRGTRARPTPPMPPAMYHSYLYGLGRLKHLPHKPKTNQRVNFLDLPAEVRRNTYSYLPPCRPYRPMPEDGGYHLNGESSRERHRCSSLALSGTCRKIHNEMIPEFYKTFYLRCDYHLRDGIPSYFTGMAFMPADCIEAFSGLSRLGRNLEHVKEIVLSCESITALVHRRKHHDGSASLSDYDAYSTRPLDDFRHIYELLRRACPNLRSIRLTILPDEDARGINKNHVWNNRPNGNPTDAEVCRRIVKLGIQSLLSGLKHFRNIENILVRVGKHSIGESRPRKIAKELAFQYKTWESKGDYFFALHNPLWKPPEEKEPRTRPGKHRPRRVGVIPIPRLM